MFQVLFATFALATYGSSGAIGVANVLKELGPFTSAWKMFLNIFQIGDTSRIARIIEVLVNLLLSEDSLQVLKVINIFITLMIKKTAVLVTPEDFHKTLVEKKKSKEKEEKERRSTAFLGWLEKGPQEIMETQQPPDWSNFSPLSTNQMKKFNWKERKGVMIGTFNETDDKIKKEILIVWFTGKLPKVKKGKKPQSKKSKKTPTGDSATTTESLSEFVQEFALNNPLKESLLERPHPIEDLQENILKTVGVFSLMFGYVKGTLSNSGKLKFIRAKKLDTMGLADETLRLIMVLFALVLGVDLEHVPLYLSRIDELLSEPTFLKEVFELAKSLKIPLSIIEASEDELRERELLLSKQRRSDGDELEEKVLEELKLQSFENALRVRHNGKPTTMTPDIVAVALEDKAPIISDMKAGNIWTKFKIHDILNKMRRYRAWGEIHFPGQEVHVMVIMDSKSIITKTALRVFEENGIQVRQLARLSTK